MKLLVFLIAIIQIKIILLSLLSTCSAGGVRRSLEGNYGDYTSYYVKGYSINPLEYYRPRSTNYNLNPVMKELKSNPIGQKTDIQLEKQSTVGKSISFPGTPVTSTQKVSRDSVNSVMKKANEPGIKLLDPNHAFTAKYSGLKDLLA